MTSGPSHGRAEDTPLLHSPHHRESERNDMEFSLASLFRWKAHPYWLIPVVLVLSMSRGVTMSPRIQVYKAIACRSLSSDPPGVGLATLINGGQCSGADASDVQARAAKIQAAVVTTMSTLSAITTGFWSRAGDRHGRKNILIVFLVGALLMEAVFVLVMKSDTLFGRHGENLILVGPILEGLVGGLSTFNGVVHAYISDCTRHGSRSKIFSTVQGMVFVGLASGPPFAGLFLPRVGYSDSFFYTSIALIFFNIIYVAFVCPESLTPADNNGAHLEDDEETVSKASALSAARNLVSRFFKSLLSPILMFAPRRVPSIAGRNFSMPLVGLALFLYLVSTGVYSAKYLYAQHVFDWTTAELGYYMSILWFTRAFNLLVFLPIVISYLKPKPTSPPGTNPNARDITAEVNFDRYLAQVSVGVDGLADSLVALTASRSQAMFTALSCLSSFTSGGNPTLHSLGAICLHACGYSSEVGTLFGAMGVLSAVAHIISPSIYALTYSRSVANFPEGIFVLAAALLFSAVLLLSRVRPDENEIALIHNHSRRRSVDRSPSVQRGSRQLSESYSYDAIPAYDAGRDFGANSDDEEERRRSSQDGNAATRSA
ncbi:MFS general substrate transporter [Coprinellus micaceus]|uniref:MFS general substrate transporter n=1 Tax=Coprinellus micaceus TaxID=71717 RepID=A0A4Y7TK75_COPMI|nr:MFS general substrate transporter [Coprinellus micaceus]